MDDSLDRQPEKGEARAMDSSSSRPAAGDERIAILLELSSAFTAELKLDELLPLILDRTKRVLRAEATSILLIDRETGELHFPVTSSASASVDASLHDLRFPADRGVAGAALSGGRTIHVPDVSQDQRFYSAIDRETGQQTREIVCAPLRAHGEYIGVMEALNPTTGNFTPGDVEFLDALAGPVSIAIENARLYEELRASENRLRHEVDGLRRERVHRGFPEVVGTSPALARVFSLMESAVPSSITVLLEGETGVGKEVIARSIHNNGPRRDAPFVALNCGALPEALLQSELFGAKRGAYTGATEDKQGLFEAADGGTLFLDEIGETSSAMQVELLRVLQEGEIRRVGETQIRKVDVRVISATNLNLAEEVKEKRFREDLYYRISVFPIEVPPLRDRRSDIPELASMFLRRLSERSGKPPSPLSPDTLDRLSNYPWPGNVRELENEMERASALALEGRSIGPELLSERILAASVNPPTLPSSHLTLREARAHFEREYIADVLGRHDGNATRAARSLGLSRQMLQRKIKAYRLRD